MFYLKDDKGTKSQTTTLVWLGLLVACAKLFVAGGKFWGMEFGEFSGADFALVVTPFLGLLAHKRHVNASANRNKEQMGESAQSSLRKRS